MNNLIQIVFFTGKNSRILFSSMHDNPMYFSRKEFCLFNILKCLLCGQCHCSPKSVFTEKIVLDLERDMK